MVIYDAKLMDDWLYAGFKVDIGQHSAQTYCKRVNDPYKPGDYGQITLLAHELIHSRQCEQFNGAAKFDTIILVSLKAANWKERLRIFRDSLQGGSPSVSE